MNSPARQALTKYWGYGNFRPLQEDIINSVLDGRDTLALMPTGGGKSICFQVPAMVMDGLCIVISPLIALMKDQVENLRAKGIPAVSVISGMSRKEIDITLDNCVYGRIKFLYISPERLSSDLFLERLKNMKVGLLAIDEAHCISQWGYDFRPSYLKIADIRTELKDVPVLALTATATRTVEDDIQKRLAFREKNVFRKSFERPNISYVVLNEEDKLRRMMRVINRVKGSGIVYVRTRKKTREIAAYLNNQNIRSEHYHAGLPAEKRNEVQDNWKKDKTQVVVATNAFGMGIDKGNVRFVIHIDCPESLEAYYQEAGRAGRDEQRSFAVLLFNETDKREMLQRAETGFPPLASVKKTYQAICSYLQLPVGAGKGVSFDFDISTFCSSFDLPVMETFNCIRILELQGLISLDESSELRSRVNFRMHADSLYEFQVKNPQLDHFIKTLLRLYEGIFDEYIFINENELSLRAGMTKDETSQMLTRLDKLNVLSYLPAKNIPQLTFTEERLDTKNLVIDRENLSDRKKRYEDRLKGMLKYAESNTRCRSQLLLEYFGEKNDTRCGNCDYCLGRNKVKLNDLEFELAYKKVKDLLSQKPARLENLIDGLNPSGEKDALHVIEWMLDHQRIRYTGENLLEWSGDEV